MALQGLTIQNFTQNCVETAKIGEARLEDTKLHACGALGLSVTGSSTV